MINKWLIESKINSRYKYPVIEINEQVHFEKQIINYLALSLLSHFRDLKHLKRMFENEPEEILENYVRHKVFPDISDRLSTKARILNMNVRQGDWGEVLTSMIASEVRALEISFKKLRYKLNREKSLLGIDVISFQKDKLLNPIEAILFESKTRITYNKEIGIEAYISLCKNSQEAFIDILNFISTQYFEKHEYEMADKFDQLIKNPESIKKTYHAFIIMEKEIWKEEILNCLDSEAFDFNNININVLLIEDMKSLIHNTYESVVEVAKEIVYG